MAPDVVDIILILFIFMVNHIIYTYLIVGHMIRDPNYVSLIFPIW